MKHSTLAAATITTLTAAAAFGATPAAGAGADSSGYASTVLDLRFSERLGADTAQDSSGRDHDGDIGTHLKMNGSYADWDRHAPSEGIPYGFEHLVTVPDAADRSLDPGAGNFSIEFRFRTSDSFGNIMQKGQSQTAGGQVKLQIPNGKLSCMFKTAQGTATAGSGAVPLNDNQWHVVLCDRTPTTVSMYVDGVRTGRINKPTGALDNTKPWTFGGKSDCDAVKVTCDYFAGDIDYVTMTKA